MSTTFPSAVDTFPAIVPHGLGTSAWANNVQDSILALENAVLDASRVGMPDLNEDALALSTFIPADYGLKAWTFDPIQWASGLALTPAGTIFWQRIHVRKQISVSALIMFINTAGVTLTAGQCFGLLYGQSPNFTQVAFTADQSTNWQSVGYKSMALVNGPYTLTAGDYFSAVYYNGTTGPAFGRGGGSNIINGPLVGSAARFGTAQTGITNVAPGALSGMTPFNAGYWAALA